jgi:predicted metal-dependent enzyme (double-stranded beta helix superfamily)
MTNIARLRDFVTAATKLVDLHGSDEAALLEAVKPLVADLVAVDDWLPEDYAKPDAQYYRQYLLHADPLERLSVVSFVWGPGQKTPVHDHRVWGVVGVLRGAELSVSYERDAEGKLIAQPEERLERGAVAAVSPIIGDIHTISNALTDKPSISIHVYGGNIGAIHRASFKPETGEEKLFISGYSSTHVPNLWDRSQEGR